MEKGLYMSDEPLISILVPIYNIVDYVEKCINSIIMQSYQRIEIILVDDGSTDGSSDICDRYKKKDSRIKVIHKENGGLVSARKAGAEMATGDYILNVDGDDWIEQDRIEHAVCAIKRDPVDIVYLDGISKDRQSGSFCIKSSKNIAGTYRGTQLTTEIVQLFIQKKCFKREMGFGIFCYCVKRELYKINQSLVKDTISQGEDQLLVYFLLTSGDSITIIDSPTYHYVERTSSLSFISNHSEYHGIAEIYKCMKKRNIEFENKKELDELIVFYVVRQLLVCDYYIFQDSKYHYLYPYTKVEQGERIIVYGAGQFGRRLVDSIEKNKEYQLVAWVDKNTSMNDRVVSVNKIKEFIFDHIIIAIVDYDLAYEIRDEIARLGISHTKIAMMDSNVICEENLPERFLKMLK